jgi:hypothetical protein
MISRGDRKQWTYSEIWLNTLAINRGFGAGVSLVTLNILFSQPKPCNYPLGYLAAPLSDSLLPVAKK